MEIKQRKGCDLDKGYEEVDLRKVYSKYNLDDMRKEIEANKDEFKLYAYVVLNNNNLGIYKEQVLKMFKVYVDNKKYFELYFLLSALKDLSIIEVNDINNGTVAADYNDIGIQIRISKRQEKKFHEQTLYHELMHFFDYRAKVAGDVQVIYKCNDKYVFSTSNAMLPKCIYADSLENRFIDEGGAEVFSKNYIYRNSTLTYFEYTRILNVLSYIFGYDQLRDVFFSKNSTEKLYYLFSKNGFTHDETLKIVKVFNDSLDKNEYIDELINIYEKVNRNKWYKDEIFVFILRNSLYSFSGTTHEGELYNHIASESITNIIKNKYSYEIISSYSIIDNDLYIFCLDEFGTAKTLIYNLDSKLITT